MNEVETLEEPITEAKGDITDVADNVEFIDAANPTELADQITPAQDEIRATEVADQIGLAQGEMIPAEVAAEAGRSRTRWFRLRLFWWQ